MANKPDGSAAAFAQAWSQIAVSTADDASRSEEFRARLLDFASETPDNLNCAGRIRFGDVGRVSGLKLGGAHVLLSELAHELEDLPRPESVKEAFPDLSEADWDAFTRLTTLLYASIERK